MNPNKLVNQIVNLAKANSPEILTALGVSGVVTTTYLTAKATFKASRVIEKEQERLDEQPKSHPLDNKEKAKLVWTLYVPSAISGAVTIVCIISSSRASGRRTAAAVTAYSISEKAFSEYKDKVAEQLTANKQQKILDEIAQDRINQTPPPAIKSGDNAWSGRSSLL